jgi:hypothetical protein
MSFFDDIPAPDLEDGFDHSRPPEWAGPPENVVGATVAIDLVLVNTGDIAVALGGMTVYATGVAFEIEILRREYPDDDEDLFRSFHRPREGGFRLGVELPGGVRLVGDREPDGDEPRLSQRGGGGGGLSYTHRLWLWPLPDEGVLRVACEWRAMGVEETVHEIDTAPIRAAALRAVEVWPDTRPIGEYW